MDARCWGVVESQRIALIACWNADYGAADDDEQR